MSPGNSAASPPTCAESVEMLEVIDHGSYIPLTGDCVRAP